MSDYKVQLDVYSGPLDLLLYLIRRDEVDIYDIPIARVTEQFVAYCDTLRLLDPNIAGEFLVLAATLMEIKSRLLLPTPPPESDDLAAVAADPRNELVRQLLDYKRFKDASLGLADRAAAQSQRFGRGQSDEPPQDGGTIDLEDIQIWDLVAAFNQLLSATGRGPVTHDVVFDDTPITLHAADIIDRLSREGSLHFERVFSGRTRAETIGLFLALLELIRQTRIRATQESPFGPIQLELLSAEPIHITDSYEYQPRDADDADRADAAAEDLTTDERSAGDDDAVALRLVSADEELNDENDEVMQEIARISTEPRDPNSTN